MRGPRRADLAMHGPCPVRTSPCAGAALAVHGPCRVRTWRQFEGLGAGEDGGVDGGVVGA
jgi:hypothetical protein